MRMPSTRHDTLIVRLSLVCALLTFGVCVGGIVANAMSATNVDSKAAAPPPSLPTFNADIAPILYRQCVSCHRPGEAGPMSLRTFADVRPWARAIKAKVLAREMPPWGADPGIGSFRNARVLSQTEVETLVRWVDAGSPEGPGAPPPPPDFPEGWNGSMNRPPDRVLELPIEFTLPASGEIPTFTVWSQLPFGEDRFVEAIEVRPSNRRVVHHGGISVGDLPRGTEIGLGPLWDDGPLSEGVAVFKDGRPFRAMIGEEFGYPLIFYVPDGGFLRFPKGVAKRLPARKYLAWGMHFTTTGQPEHTHLTMGLWFAQSRVEHEALTMTVNEKVFVDGEPVPVDAHGRLLIPSIPARASNWEISGTLAVKSNATLYSLWPHMHYRGKDMKFSVVDPDGHETTILSVSKYSPLWQTTYELTNPLKIRAGSTIRAVAHYDNSPGNRLNPAPNEDVLWGPQSWNEMFHAFVELSTESR